jgi:DNA-binding transcriptional LysR family regulator
MESLSRIEVFVTAAEHLSLVAAGRHLGISASAVGKSISRLEEKLNVQLFHRSTRSMTLTPEGALFLERSRRILSEIEAAEQELSLASSTPRGRLRVSLPPLGNIVLAVLSEFAREYPEIELDLDFTDRRVDLIEEGFDAVVRAGEPNDSRLLFRKLGSYPIRLVASPDYLKRRGVPEVPADLLGHSCLHYRSQATGKLQHWPLRKAETEGELALPVSMVCNDIDTRVHFALEGLGIARLPDFSVREHVQSGRLQEVLPDYTNGENILFALWPASKYPSPKIRAFVETLRRRLPIN